MDAGAAAIASEKKVQSSSYTYWVRQATSEAAPLPVPRKIDPLDACNQTNGTHIGSAWNRAGTWEEKNMNTWSSNRIKELVMSVGSLEFPNGKAGVTEVTRCSGDAFLVTVRNKKRVGYTYELTIKLKGEWEIQGEKRKLGGRIDVPEFSLGELDDLKIEVKLTEDKDVVSVEDKQRVISDLKLFLQPLKKRLLQFEEELKAQ